MMIHGNNNNNNNNTVQTHNTNTNTLHQTYGQALRSDERFDNQKAIRILILEDRKIKKQQKPYY